MVKVSNIPAYRAALYANIYTNAAAQNVERLASTKKINSAADSPGEISFVNRLDSRILSMRRAALNIQDSISMFQTADSALSGTDGISAVLATIREKVLEATNGTLTANDRQTIQDEIYELIDEIDALTSTTEFNTRKLLNGDMSARITSNSSDVVAFATRNVSSDSLELSDVTGASFFKSHATTSATVTVSANSTYLDEVASRGTLPTSITTTGFGNAQDFELVFTSTAAFTVYDLTGSSWGTGTTSGVSTLSGGQTLSFVVGTGTFSDGYKIKVDVQGGGATNVITEGNTGTFNSVTGSFDEEGALNTHFFVKYDYDGSKLSYAVYDADDTRISNWASAGSTLSTYADSTLGTSTLTVSTTGAKRGDIYEVQFNNYTSVNSSGGTFVIEAVTGSMTVSWDGNDTLSDIADRINAMTDSVATASVVDSSSTDGPELFITSVIKGSQGSLRLSDSTGSLMTALGMTRYSSSGTDASFRLDGTTFTSSSGIFEGISGGFRIEIKDSASEENVLLNVSDAGVRTPLDFNGASAKEMYILDMSAARLGLIDIDGDYTLDVSTVTKSQQALAKVDAAMDTVNAEAGRIGSVITSLGYQLDTISGAVTPAQSSYDNHVLIDVDEETTDYARNRVLRDTATAMVAQANVDMTRVMQLLGLTFS